MTHINDCWSASAWAHNAWVDGSWCPEGYCISDEIGTVWEVNTWQTTSWCQGTWADRTIPPTPPAPVIVEARRWPGPSIVIYDEVKQLEKIRKRLREEEEVIIL